MSTPERRRPLPALVAIAALTLLTALVWFRVLHRGADAADSKPKSSTSKSTCPTSTLPASSKLPKQQLVTLIVLNSTTRTGLAGNARKALIADGFKVPALAVNDGATYGGHGLIAGVAEIRYGPSQRLAAALVAYYLPGAALVQTDSSSSSVIVSLGAKFTALASQASATAAMTAAHVSLVSPAPTSAAPPPSHSSSC